MTETTFAPMSIPGVTADVTTRYSFWSGFQFFVDGQRVKPHGFPRNKLTLPGTAGPVEARIKGGLFRAHPVLVVDGAEHTTGPPTPGRLQALALLPVLSIIVLQGALGFVIAFGGVAVNMGIVRGPRADRAKTALMLATFAVVVALDVAIVAAILAATD